MSRPAEETRAAEFAAATACSGLRAVSGLAIMSSTHEVKEKVVSEDGAGAAVTAAAMARATTEAVNLTILDVGCINNKGGLMIFEEFLECVLWNREGLQPDERHECIFNYFPFK